MKITQRVRKGNRSSTFYFPKGYVALVEDIEDLNGFIGPFVEEVPGSSGEEYIFLKSVKITVTISID